VPNHLDKHFDALIVGGGIIGMLTARSLQSEGLSVAIIDKGKLGGEATWAAGGILSPLNPWQYSAETQSLIEESKQRFATLADNLQQETGVDPEFIESGMLVFDVEEKQQALTWAKNNNEIIEVLSSHDLLKFEVNISKNFSEALYFPKLAQVRPPKLIAALLQSLSQRRVEIFDNLLVEKLLIEENCVTGVATKNQSLYAEKVIVCSGAWAKYLLPNKTTVDIEPVRGQMLLYFAYSFARKVLSHPKT